MSDSDRGRKAGVSGVRIFSCSQQFTSEPGSQEAESDGIQVGKSCGSMEATPCYYGR